MALLRPLLERASRGRVLRRRLPREFGGQTLYVTPDAALSLWLPGLARADFPLLLRFATELVLPGAMVWDLGANVGLFAFAAAFRAGHSGAVVAIEPDEWLADLLRRSALVAIPASAPVHVLAVAVSDHDGTADFCIAQRGRAASHLAAVPGSSEAGGTRETRRVRTVTLDALLATLRPPTLVKIDVEGAEAHCLAGAGRLLSEIRPVLLCEVAAWNSGMVSGILRRQRYTILDAAAAPATRRPLATAPWNTLAVPEELSRETPAASAAP
jgi:FkbM family methyltransferase